MTDQPSPDSRDFIREIIRADLASGKHAGVVTRFPPEPNGYLHIGHAKSICLNFGVAAEFGGRCHLRFDDTNPTKEEMEYIESIQRDVRWLGFDWGEHGYYASDYFEQLYEWADPPHPGGQGLRRRPVGRRDPGPPRHPDRARAGEPLPQADDRGEPRPLPAHARGRVRGRRRGCCGRRSTWRRGNINLRDPVLYRILHASHPRTGDAWCIYPTYDYAHGQSDAIEGITHSPVHARVRGPPPALRLVPRQPAGAVAAAPDRVRPSQPELHRDARSGG